MKNPTSIKKKVYNVPANFKSSDGYTFSKTDYQGTLKAIFGAITYAKKKGYNYVVFPKLKFYASAYNTGVHYYVPSNMTIEFPKGSELHMMYPTNLPNGVSASDATKCEFHIFEFGVPGNDYKNRCENSQLKIYTYYGERFEGEKVGQRTRYRGLRENGENKGEKVGQRTGYRGSRENGENKGEKVGQRTGYRGSGKMAKTREKRWASEPGTMAPVVECIS